MLLAPTRCEPGASPRPARRHDRLASHPRDLTSEPGQRLRGVPGRRAGLRRTGSATRAGLFDAPVPGYTRHDDASDRSGRDADAFPLGTA